MLIVQLGHGRHVNLAPSWHHAAAARMERAPAGSLEGAGDRSFDRDQALPGGLAQARHGPQEVHGVGVLGVAEDFAHRPILHHLSEVHDGDRVSDLRDHTQIVSDKHDCHAQPLLQPAHQFEDLRLDRHVQGGRGLVRNQQATDCMTGPWRSSPAGAYRPRTGEDSYPPAARRRNAHQPQQFNGHLARLVPA